MTTPCPECPFLRKNNFTYASLKRHASGEFACHKQCKLSEDGVYVKRNEKTQHCAGALIFLEKHDPPQSHQMMRICERLGAYDYTKLDMTADVGSSPEDYRKGDR